MLDVLSGASYPIDQTEPIIHNASGFRVQFEGRVSSQKRGDQIA